MIKTTLLLTLLVFLMIGISYGQNEYNTFDENYTPPKNSILGAGTESESIRSDYEKSTYSFKFNPGRLIRSYLGFALEYNFVNDFSVQARFDKSLGNDHWQHITLIMFRETGIMDVGNNYSSGKSSINHIDILTTPDADISSSTYLLGLSLRLYDYSEYVTTQFYELGFNYYNTNYSIIPVEINSSSYSSYSSNSQVLMGSGKIKQTHYFANWGLQWESGNKIKIAHELYVGFGIRLFRYSKYSTETFGDVDYALKTKHKETSFAFTSQFGYVLSIGM